MKELQRILTPLKYANNIEHLFKVPKVIEFKYNKKMFILIRKIKFL